MANHDTTAGGQESRPCKRRRGQASRQQDDDVDDIGQTVEDAVSGNSPENAPDSGLGASGSKPPDREPSDSFPDRAPSDSLKRKREDTVLNKFA